MLLVALGHEGEAIRAHPATTYPATRGARRLTTILPAMTLANALDTTRIHRVAGVKAPARLW